MHGEPTSGRSASRWHSREVFVQRGEWPALRDLLPSFVLRDFVAPGFASANPYFRAVVNEMRASDSDPVPVAIVGPNYGLVQHSDVGDAVVNAMRTNGVWFDRMPCKLEMTELGEWMHIRFMLDESMAVVPPDGYPVHFCLDLYNSVDGKSRLFLQPSWLRLVCDNGMVVRSSKGFGLADVHDRHVRPGDANEVLARAISAAADDARKLEEWWSLELSAALDEWADGPLLAQWGRHDAARVFHICRTGTDGDPEKFVSVPPSRIWLTSRREVPGASNNARSKYDVAQALSWVASNKQDLVRRDKMLQDIPGLLDKIKTRKIFRA